MADRTSEPVPRLSREPDHDPAHSVLQATLAEALSSASRSQSSRPPARNDSQRIPPVPASARNSAAPATPGVTTVVLTHHQPPPGTARLPFVQDSDSPTAAAFRVLRHKLREVDSPRIIAITSPNAAEGKTTCAIDLAMALAEHGRSHVLLLEANFRSPHLAAALGFSPPSCFGAQMAAHMKTPASPWQVTAAFFPNLHVLAVDPASVGQWVLNPPALKNAMDQLRASSYEHIIVDCPPTLGSADVNVIEDFTDGVLMTAVAGRTSATSLQQAARHLAPANILGVVLLQR